MRAREGWVSMVNARRRHYLNTVGRSLCGRWLFSGKREPQDDYDNPLNCGECQKKIREKQRRIEKYGRQDNHV